MGDEPILPIFQPFTIDIMPNWITDQYFKVKSRAKFRYVWTLLESIKGKESKENRGVKKIYSETEGNIKLKRWE